MLTLIDEYTRECLAIRVARRPGSYEVINNGPGSVARELRKWMQSSARGRCTSSQGVRGRTVRVRASTEKA
jgi:hypothetical protein